MSSPGRTLDYPADAGAARVILTIHIANEYGWCAGCLEAWARLAPVPCPTAKAARSLLDGPR